MTAEVSECGSNRDEIRALIAVRPPNSQTDCGKVDPQIAQISQIRMVEPAPRHPHLALARLRRATGPELKEERSSCDICAICG